MLTVRHGLFRTIDGSDKPPGDDDQMPPPPPPSEVRIKVHDGAGPLDGVAVVFLDANDGVVADVVTDAQGSAVAKLDTGSVTVIRPGAAAQPDRPGSSASVYTYVGVKAGDQLDLALATTRPSMPISVDVKVPLTEDNSPVQIMTPCGSGVGVPPTVTVSLDGCGSETDFYVSDLGGEPSAFLKRATIAPNIDMSTETYRGALTDTLAVSNTPSGASVTIEKRIETDLFRPVFSTGQVPMPRATPSTSRFPTCPARNSRCSRRCRTWALHRSSARAMRTRAAQRPSISLPR